MGLTGVLAVAADGSWVYSADNTQAVIQNLALGDTLTDAFTVTNADSVTTQTVTITINGVDEVPNVAPTASNDAVTTDEDTALAANVPAAIDTDGTVVSYDLVADIGEGSLIFNADGSYTFDPAGAFDDLDVGASRDVTFAYTVTDDDGAVSGSATVTITVTGVNDVFGVAGNTATVTEDKSTVFVGSATQATLFRSGSLTLMDTDASDGLSVSAAGDTFIWCIWNTYAQLRRKLDI